MLCAGDFKAVWMATSDAHGVAHASFASALTGFSRAVVLTSLCLFHFGLALCCAVVLFINVFWPLATFLMALLFGGLFMAWQVIPWPLYCFLGALAVPSSFCVRVLSGSLIKRMGQPADDTDIIAFHGTTAENARSIEASGFRPSAIGMLGSGVYFSRDLHKAMAYGSSDGKILQVRVRVGKICIVDHQGHDRQHSWRSDFDTAWVPARCGMVGSGLEEGCVKDASRVELVRVWPKNWTMVFFTIVRLGQMLRKIQSVAFAAMQGDRCAYWTLFQPASIQADLSSGVPEPNAHAFLMGPLPNSLNDQLKDGEPFDVSHLIGLARVPPALLSKYA